MSQRPLARNEKIFVLFLFSALFAYCLYGALTGDLYIPSKSGHGDAHLRGWPAWMVTASPLAFYLAIRVRHGPAYFGPRRKVFFELSLLAAGLVLLGASVRHC